MSLYNLLKKRSSNEISSFCVPGHKNNFKDIDLSMIDFDTTELNSTDDLYCPKESISNLENDISKIYKSEISVISTGGNTLSIQTMLRLFYPCGGKMLVVRNVHKSVVNAMALLKIESIFINIPLYDQINYKKIDKEIKKIKNINEITALFITSPTYFGQIADIKKIKNIIGDMMLLVDNAHGAHLNFLPQNLHPIKLGADACADSAHKTLPVLTGGSWLHISKNAKDTFFKGMLKKSDVKNAMSLFGSTSPSFLIILSIEMCVNWLKKHDLEFKNLINEIKIVKKIAKKFNILDYKCYDPTRIVLDFSKYNINDKNLINYFNKNKIEPEFILNKKVVLIPSAFNKRNDWIRLKNTVILENKKFKMKNNFFKDKIIKNDLIFKIPLNTSMFLPSENINIEKSLGKICAEPICICPPGIVLIFPGEIINKNKYNELIRNKIFNIKVIKQCH